MLIDAGLGGAGCAELTANYASTQQTNGGSAVDGGLSKLVNIGWGTTFTVAAVQFDPFPDATTFSWPYSQVNVYPSN